MVLDLEFTNSSAQCVPGCDTEETGPGEGVGPGLSLLETSATHPALMETYKYFSHLSEKDLVIWQVWSQNLPEECILVQPRV